MGQIEDTKLLASLGGLPDQQLATPKESASSATNGKLRTGPTTSTEDRALALLGSGIGVEQTAMALGVDPSRISQLLSDDGFAAKVATARYEALQKHNIRDNAYDGLEDSLIDKLETMLPTMYKTNEILRAISVINGAKRRGQSAPDQTVNNQNVVQINLPKTIAKDFTVQIDINNTVIKAGEQELETIQSGTLLNNLENRNARAALIEATEEDAMEVDTSNL